MTNDPASLEYSSRAATEPFVFSIGASYFSKRVLATVDCSLQGARGWVTLNPFFAANAKICELVVAMEVAGDQKTY